MHIRADIGSTGRRIRRDAVRTVNVLETAQRDNYLRTGSTERTVFAVRTSGRCCAESEASDTGILPGRGVIDALLGFSH